MEADEICNIIFCISQFRGGDHLTKVLHLIQIETIFLQGLGELFIFFIQFAMNSDVAKMKTL